MRDKLLSLFKQIRDNFIWTADPAREIQWMGQTIVIEDVWILMEPDEFGVLRGDCEDFALYCSDKLKELFNIPLSNRKLTYCQTETGEGHMILSVDIDGSNYVFDNRQRTLTTLRKLKSAGYSKFAQPVGPINSPWVQI